MKKIKFSYGDVEGDASQTFRNDLYIRLGIQKLFKRKNVLDLGCGYGLDSVNFSKFANSVVGVDLEYHSLWEKIKKVKFVKSLSESLPFKDGTFNAIYMKDLLHHVKNVEKTLEEAKRVSSSDANIIILEGNRYNPIFYFFVTKLKGHKHFSQGEFKKMILSVFANAEFIHLEAYPPFFLNRNQFKILISLEKIINKAKILSPFFSYNVAVIRGNIK